MIWTVFHEEGEDRWAIPKALRRWIQELRFARFLGELRLTLFVATSSGITIKNSALITPECICLTILLQGSLDCVRWRFKRRH